MPPGPACLRGSVAALREHETVARVRNLNAGTAEGAESLARLSRNQELRAQNAEVTGQVCGVCSPQGRNAAHGKG